MKSFYSIVSRTPARGGINLAELLTATVITGITSMVSVIGLQTIFNSSEETNLRAMELVELNRSLDFISTELQGAASVAFPPSCPPSLPSGAPACAQAVLEVNVPAAVSANPIYYYLTDAVANEELGDRAIYRQGPAFDINGDYDSATTVTAALLDGLRIGDTTRPCLLVGANVAGDSQFFACSDADVVEVHLQASNGLAASSRAYFRIQ